MDTRDRAETFTRYAGLELKGKITARGFTAKAVAERMGRSPAAFNRWVNGKAELPLPVLCEAAEVIGVDPDDIVSAAYDRMVVELGERDGSTYDHDAPSAAPATVTPIGYRAPRSWDEIPIVEAPNLDELPNAAKRGIRKADQEPHAE